MANRISVELGDSDTIRLGKPGSVSVSASLVGVAAMLACAAGAGVAPQSVDGRVAVRCGALIDGRADEPLHDAVVVIEGDRIVDAKFKTFGCGSAIASSSLATEWVKGKTLDEAGAIRNTEIVEELSLPPVKIHCSVLAEDAIKSAVNDYKSKQEPKQEQEQ